MVQEVTSELSVNKGNNYRTPNNLPKGKSKLINQQTDQISQQQENWKNRNAPDLVQAFLKKLVINVMLLKMVGQFFNNRNKKCVF